MNEPTYSYIKGQGWVVYNCLILIEIIGSYRITLELRQPQIGEYFFTQYSNNGDPLEGIMNHMRVGTWRTLIEDGRFNSNASTWDYAWEYLCNDARYHIVTASCEKVTNGPE